MEETEYSCSSFGSDENDSISKYKKKELTLDLKSIKEMIKKHYGEVESQRLVCAIRDLIK